MPAVRLGDLVEANFVETDTGFGTWGILPKMVAINHPAVGDYQLPHGLRCR